MTYLNEVVDLFYDIHGLVTGLFRGTYTQRILFNTWALFADLWYYIIIGAFAAVVISELMGHRAVRRLLTRGGSLPVIIASCIGVISPMCTFAAIPLVGGLMAAGVPLPPLMAFLIASPLMNPSLFIITWGAIGAEMAVARTLSALVLGISGGLFAELALRKGWLDLGNLLRRDFSPGHSLPSCRQDGAFPPATTRDRFADLLKRTVAMTLFISKYFLLALVIAGAVQTLVSPRWIALLLGGKGFKSVLLGGLLGVPLYVCGGGTVALIGVLVGMGKGQGAALAFFITGPATKISTIISLNAVLRRKVALVYLVVTLVGGVLIGYGYSRFSPELSVDPQYYGRLESTEDAVTYRSGIGSPTGDY